MKNSGIMKLTTIILALFFVVFAGYHAIRHFYSSYSTESAYRYSVYHSVLTEGLMVREEKVLAQPVTGYLRFAAQEGEKVKAGSVLAYTYSGHSQASLAQTAGKSRQELAMLQEIYDQYGQSGYYDAGGLSENIDIALDRLTSAAVCGNYGQLDSLRLRLQKNINLKELLTGDDAGIAARVNELTGALSQQETGSAVYSTGVGYFSHSVDGLETAYSPGMIGSITLDQLNTALSSEVTYQDNTLGRLILDDQWYLVAAVTEKQAAEFPVGSEVEITFAGSDNECVAASVVQSQSCGDGKTVILTVSGNEINSDTVSRRCASVKIASKAYTGIRFDADLLHIVDGVKGVYVDNGYTVKFKKVDIVYTGNDYYLSRMNYTSEETLNLFDKLIITEKTLSDGMAISDL